MTGFYLRVHNKNPNFDSGDTESAHWFKTCFHSPAGVGVGGGEQLDLLGGPVMDVCLLQEAPRVTPWAPLLSGT